MRTIGGGVVVVWPGSLKKGPKGGEFIGEAGTPWNQKNGQQREECSDLTAEAADNRCSDNTIPRKQG